jgi:hypothetical protein
LLESVEAAKLGGVEAILATMTPVAVASQDIFWLRKSRRLLITIGIFDEEDEPEIENIEFLDKCSLRLLETWLADDFFLL